MNLFSRTLRRFVSPRRRSRWGHWNQQDCPFLENRVLLASLVSSTKLTYQDIDGDDVSVTFSKPVLTVGNVNSIFQFNTGTVNGSNAVPQQLRQINLVGVVGAAGTTITTVATRNPVKGGDGLAALGQINATGLDLGAVMLDGDLGRILAGDANPLTQGLGTLRVKSMGRYGTTTGATDLHSVIEGQVSSLNVRADIKGAFFEATGGLNGVNGTIGSVAIGGSLIGTADANSGRVHTTGNLGAVTVGGDVRGGGGSHSGLISSFRDIVSVTIGGSIIGGSNTFAGGILTDFLGGGPNEGGPGGHIGAVKVLGDLLGGSDTGAGSIISESGKLASVTIGGSMIAGSANRSAHIHSGLDLGAVSITGSVIGGAGELSGEIESYGKMASVTIGGSLRGGAGEFSGSVASALDMGAAKIVGEIVGGGGAASGILSSGGKLASATVGGSVRGGSGDNTGQVLSTLDAGALKITGDVIGGSGINSGQVFAYRKLASLNIGGSLIGGTGQQTGRVVAQGELGSLTITGNIIGGSASGVADLRWSGLVQAGRIGTMTLGGSLIAGTDNTTGVYLGNGVIEVHDDIGTLTIKGSIIGNATNSAKIYARGQVAPPAGSDVAIGTLRVTGRVEYGLVHAGYTDLFLGGANADAQIGTVTVGGDWVASSLVAGAQAGLDGIFGTPDDGKITSQDVIVKDVPNVLSKITSITIGGEAIGTVFTSDHFGFVAEFVGNLSINSNLIPLLANGHNDNILLGSLIDGQFGDIRLREI